LIEWFASKDIEKIEDAEFWAVRPIKALRQQEEPQEQFSLLVLRFFHSRGLPEPSSARRSDSG